MKFFGLIALLLAVATWSWLAMKGPTSTVPDAETMHSYGDTLDAAKDAARQLSSGSVEVYAGISVPVNTEELDLSGRGLTGSLKAEVRQLKYLKRLDLSDNKFTGLPAEVGQLSELEELNLANNPLTGLPHELGGLKKLNVLDVSGTQYSTIDLAIITEQLSAQVQVITD